MAKTKKEIKDAVISKTKDTKKKVDEIEEIKEEEMEELKEEVKVKIKEAVKEEIKTKKTKKEKKGLIAGIKKEMKQVVWPSAGDILKSTVAVIVICVFLCLFFTAITLFMAWLKSFIGGLTV